MLKDGIVLMYCKDGVIYPVALTQEQNDMLQLASRIFFNPLKVIDRPIGPAVNLLDKEAADAVRGN